MLLDLLVILTIFSFAIPIAALLTTGTKALYLTASVTMASAVVAGVIHVLFDLPIWVVWMATIVLPSISLVVFRKTRARIKNSLSSIKTSLSEKASLGLTFMFLLLAAISIQPPLKWDARSIWFHHASWLNGPSTFFLEAQYLPAGSWPDYPFAGPALMALAWQLTFQVENLWLATQVIAVSVVLVAAFSAQALIDRFGSNRNWILRTAVLLAFLSAATQVADGYFNAGYQDTLLAASVAALFSAVLANELGKHQRLLMPTLIFIAAANVKQEGFWFAIGALLIATAITTFRKDFWSLLLIPMALGTRALWTAFSQSIGMPDNSHTDKVLERIPLIFSPGSEWSEKVSEVIQTWVIPHSLPFLILTCLSALGIALSGGQGKEKFLLALAAVVTPVGLLGTAVLTYALGETHDLQWWLGTSYTRVTSTFELLAISFAAIAVLVSLEWDTQPAVTNTKRKVRR